MLRHGPASSTAGNAVIDQRVANVWNRLEQRELKRVSRRISGYGPGRLPAPGNGRGPDAIIDAVGMEACPSPTQRAPALPAGVI